MTIENPDPPVRMRTHHLPYDAHERGKDVPAVEHVITASQSNFDHLSGEAEANAKTFNVFMTQLEDILNQMRAQVADHEGRITDLEP